jgi:hypothetical protein
MDSHGISDFSVKRGERELIVRFEGAYSLGSSGFETARFMASVIEENLESLRQDTLILDLTGLDYLWGDGILSVVILPLLRRKEPPGRVVFRAKGPTLEALRSLIYECGVDHLPLSLEQAGDGTRKCPE